MDKMYPLSKLRSQLIFSFLVGSRGIVIAIGLPILLLIYRQTNLQTNLLLDQAVLTTQASLAGEQANLQNLTLLISQRPTLRRLLAAPESTSLNPYLDTLRESGHLDLVVICDSNHKTAGASTNADPSGLCEGKGFNGFVPAEVGRPSMLVATSDLQDGASLPYQVILGKTAVSVLSQLETETVLVYFLSNDKDVLAVSDPAMDPGSFPLQRGFSGETSAPVSFPNGRSYLVSGISLQPGSILHLYGGLNVEDQLQTQRNLSQSLVMGLLLVILVAFGAGIWLSQRLSSPLDHLANVASDFSHGDLHSPVSIQTSTWEISQLANTLEDARVALEHSMNQLQSEKAWVEHLLNSIVEGILTIDHQDRIMFASEGMGRITGEERETMIGQKLDQTSQGMAAVVVDRAGCWVCWVSDHHADPRLDFWSTRKRHWGESHIFISA
jgi:PAS domain-containing protein